MIKGLDRFAVFLLWYLFVTSALADNRDRRLRELMNLRLDELMTLEISTATRHPEEVLSLPATMYVYTREDFERYGFRDLKDILKYIPGIEYAYPQSWLQGGQRGFAGSWSQTRLMVDGRETNLLFSGEAYIADQFPLSEVERVEVIQGPASSLYGADAFVGVINIVTRGATSTGTGGALTTDLHQGTRGEVGERLSGSYKLTKGSWGLSLSGAALERRGPDLQDFLMGSDFSERLTEPRRETFALGKGYYDYNRAFQAAGEVRFDDEKRNRFKIGAFHWYNFDGGNEENAEVSFNDFRDKRDQTHLYLRYERRVSDTLTASLEHHYLREDNRIGYPQRGQGTPIPPKLLEFRSEGNERNRTTFQLDYDRKDIANYLLAGTVYEDTDIPMLYGTGESFEALEPFLHQHERSLYLQDQQSFFDQSLRLTLGWRHDHHSIYNNINTVRGAAVYSFSDHYAVKLLFGEAFLAPTIFELRANPRVRPAEMTSTEVAFLYNGSSRLKGHVTVFRNRATNLIRQVREGEDERTLNLGKQTAEGAEVFARWSLSPLEGFTWYSFTGQEEDLAKHKVGLGVSWNYDESLSASLTGKWASRVSTEALTATDSVEERTIGAFRELNLTIVARELAIDPLPTLDLTLGITNLLNTNNRYPYLRGKDPIQYEEAGRVFWLGGRVYF